MTERQAIRAEKIFSQLGIPTKTDHWITTQMNRSQGGDSHLTGLQWMVKPVRKPTDTELASLTERDKKFLESKVLQYI